MTGRGQILLFIIGVLCLQAAWMLTVPPFRGVDEIDHVYRAASVVRGDVRPATKPVPDGRGLEVHVPVDMVEAAANACDQLRYVGRGNCQPTGNVRRDGTAAIASAAGTYMPLYYALVGWPSLFLDGEHSLYGMRIVSLLLCDSLLLLAAAVAMRRKSSWHRAALTVCLTPTVTYATVTAAPNAMSFAGALLMWVAWTCVSPHMPGRDNRFYLWMGTLGAVTTSITHNTGPIWVLITALLMAWIWSPVVVRSSRRTLALSFAAIFSAFCIALGWTRYSGANSLEGEWHAPTEPPPWIEVAILPARWLFQSVFGAPRPGGMTSGLVYALAFTIIALVLVAGLARATSREKQAMAVIAGTLVVLPLALTALTYSALGFAWQGRYSIPLGVGITMIAAAALNRTTTFQAPLLLALPVIAVVHVGAILSARANVAAEDAQFLTSPWVAPVLCLIGTGAWAWSLSAGLRQRGEEPCESQQDSSAAATQA